MRSIVRKLMVLCITGSASLFCGPSKMKKVMTSSSPSVGVSKFNLDEATRGKPGPAGHKGCTP